MLVLRLAWLVLGLLLITVIGGAIDSATGAGLALLVLSPAARMFHFVVGGLWGVGIYFLITRLLIRKR